MTVITNLPCLDPECMGKSLSNLAQSEATENPDLVELKASIEALIPVSFTVEEVEKAIKRLKRRKVPGPEHLIEDGQSVVICLTNIPTTITALKAIPDSLIEEIAPHAEEMVGEKKIACLC